MLVGFRPLRGCGAIWQIAHRPKSAICRLARLSSCLDDSAAASCKTPPIQATLVQLPPIQAKLMQPVPGLVQQLVWAASRTSVWFPIASVMEEELREASLENLEDLQT